MEFLDVINDLEIATEGLNIQTRKDFRSVTKMVNKTTSAAKKAMKAGNYAEAIKYCDEGITTLNVLKTRIKESGAESNNVSYGNMLIASKTAVKCVLGLLLIASACVLGSKAVQKRRNKRDVELAKAYAAGAKNIEDQAQYEYKAIASNARSRMVDMEDSIKHKEELLANASGMINDAAQDFEIDAKRFHDHSANFDKLKGYQEKSSEKAIKLANDLSEMGDELTQIGNSRVSPIRDPKYRTKRGAIDYDKHKSDRLEAEKYYNMAEKVNNFKWDTYGIDSDSKFSSGAANKLSDFAREDELRARRVASAYAKRADKFREISNNIKESKYDTTMPDQLILDDGVAPTASIGISDNVADKIMNVGVKKGGIGIVAAGTVASLVSFVKSSASKSNNNVRSMIKSIDTSIKTLAAIKGTCQELMKSERSRRASESYYDEDDYEPISESVIVFCDTVEECFMCGTEWEGLLENFINLGFNDIEAVGLFIDYLTFN